MDDSRSHGNWNYDNRIRIIEVFAQHVLTYLRHSLFNLFFLFNIALFILLNGTSCMFTPNLHKAFGALYILNGLSIQHHFYPWYSTMRDLLFSLV